MPPLRLLRFLSIATALLLGGEASALSLRGDYSVSLRGLPIGRAQLEADVGEDAYSIAFSGRVSGLARMFTDMRASARATGAVDREGVRPGDYSQRWVEGDDAETIRMQFSGAKVGGVSIEPPVKRPERYVPVTEADRSDVIDPATAIVWRAPAGAGAEICERALPVFDGRRRFELAFRFSRQQSFATGDGSYSGLATVCSIRYLPISGHRPGRKNLKFMAANEDMEVWMAPVAEGIVAPVRVRVRSPIGRVVIEAQSIAAR